MKWKPYGGSFTCMSIVEELRLVWWLIETNHAKWWQHGAFNRQQIDVDRTLMLSGASVVLFAPVRWSCGMEHRIYLYNSGSFISLSNECGFIIVVVYPLTYQYLRHIQNPGSGNIEELEIRRFLLMFVDLILV